jgi:signal transduction histidine kinase
VDANGKHGQTERAATDQSLGDEREKADEELDKRLDRVDDAADEVIADARDLADDVLRSARAKADEKLRTDIDAPVHVAVAKERSREDEALLRERATADESLSQERQLRRRAVAALLALERDQTDDDLVLERDRADAAISSRDDFLGIVSHDLRNMLNGMALSAASLMNIACEGEVARAVARNAQRIQQCTARMDRLVGDLLDVVSIEAGRLALSPLRHDASELLSETSEVFLAIAAAKQISIRSEVGAGSLFAHCDRERILQVLANLVGNAIKFTNNGGKIDLRVERVEDELRFDVADTGAGIAPEKLELVFQRFWQAENQKQAGIGLGLYISKSIVEAHGGKIWAHSRIGEGSTFCFTLPRTE